MDLTKFLKENEYVNYNDEDIVLSYGYNENSGECKKYSRYNR